MSLGAYKKKGLETSGAALLARFSLSLWRNRAGSLLQKSRLFALVEILTFILGPLVWGLTPLPRTVIPFFLFGWASLWLRSLAWRDVGLRRPRSWSLAIFGGLLASASAQFLGLRVLSPALLRLRGEALQTGSLAFLHGNFAAYLFLLVFTWPLAAVLEEMVYRGYLLNRMFDLLGRRKLAIAISLVLNALIFSLAHGRYTFDFILTSLPMGLLEGCLYLASGRNLWTSIITHGMANTISFTLAFLGYL